MLKDESEMRIRESFLHFDRFVIKRRAEERAEKRANKCIKERVAIAMLKEKFSLDVIKKISLLSEKAICKLAKRIVVDVSRGEGNARRKRL